MWLAQSMHVTEILIYVLFFLVGTAVFYGLNVMIYWLPEKKGIERLKEGNDGKRPSVRWILIALFGGAMAVVLPAYYGIGLKALTIFLFFSVLTVVAFVDIDTMEIPFVLNIIILVLGVISIWTVGGISIVERIIGMFCISLPLFLIVLVVPDGFGGGDIKLMFAAGFFLGWKATVIAFFIGLIAGGAYGVVCLARRKKGKKDHFAFGPFLSAGLVLAQFCGSGLMDRYIDMIKASFQP